jgi:hypothetical protein
MHALRRLRTAHGQLSGRTLWFPPAQHRDQVWAYTVRIMRNRASVSRLHTQSDQRQQCASHAALGAPSHNYALQAISGKARPAQRSPMAGHRAAAHRARSNGGRARRSPRRSASQRRPLTAASTDVRGAVGMARGTEGMARRCGQQGRQRRQTRTTTEQTCAVQWAWRRGCAQ